MHFEVQQNDSAFFIEVLALTQAHVYNSKRIFFFFTLVIFGENSRGIFLYSRQRLAEGKERLLYAEIPNAAFFFALLHIRTPFLCASWMRRLFDQWLNPLCNSHTCEVRSGGPSQAPSRLFLSQWIHRSDLHIVVFHSLVHLWFFSFRSLPSTRAVMCHLLACMPRRLASPPPPCVPCLVRACLILSAGPQVGLHTHSTGPQ